MKRRQPQNSTGSLSIGSSISDDASRDSPLEEEPDVDDTFISFTTTETKCEQLYGRGIELKSQGELQPALSVFLDCLKKMQECQYFAKLPLTLHQLAEIHHALQLYDKAVEYAQAEKLFYEAVIIDLVNKKGGSRTPRRKSDPAEYGDLLLRKADELEKLSHLCAREKNFQLALDYCGKVAKIQQSVLGPEHPVTINTLEYFTVLYAEVGKRDYISAMKQLESRVEIESDLPESLPAVQEEEIRCDLELSEDTVQQEESSTPDVEEGPVRDEESGTPIATHPNVDLTELVAKNTPLSTSRSSVVRLFRSVPVWLILVAVFTQMLIVGFFIM